MNKLAVVLGVAAVATLAGCKDPEYARVTPAPQDEAKSVETEAAPESKQAEKQKNEERQPEEVKSEEISEAAPKCTCAPGTKHDKPCECGAADCQCVVETKSVETESKVYILQRGDYLAKISKKYNIKVDAIKKLNNMKSDGIRLGQKLKLPGKVDVGEQSVPDGAVKKAPKKTYESYKGETKEYVVKAGDTLGKIAYSNGMNIRQLKELNGLKKDTVRIGQKLKIAANGAKPVVKEEAKPAEQKPAEKKPAEADSVVEKPAEAAPAKEEKVTEAAPVEVAPTEPKAGAAPVAASEVSTPVEGSTSYIVQEGDTLPRIAIDFEVPVARIRELNNLGEGDEVKVGQALVIPAAQ